MISFDYQALIYWALPQ